MIHTRLIARATLCAACFSVPAPALAQQFLLNGTENGEHFVVRMDAQGRVLGGTRTGSTVLGAARFCPGGGWIALAPGGATRFDDTGAPRGTIPVDASWATLDVLSDGRFAVRDPWLAFTVQVVESTGEVTEEWGTGTCAGGPNFGLRTTRNRASGAHEVWLAEECGSGLGRYDTAGNLLAYLPAPPGGIDGLFDDSCDDFVPAPDGSVWLRQGSVPAVISRYAWDGTLLTSFTVPTFSRGIAVESDGSVWVRDDSNSVLLHFSVAGRFLGLVPFPDTWSVWSFDVRPTALAPTVAGK